MMNKRGITTRRARADRSGRPVWTNHRVARPGRCMGTSGRRAATQGDCSSWAAPRRQTGTEADTTARRRSDTVPTVWSLVVAHQEQRRKGRDSRRDSLRDSPVCLLKVTPGVIPQCVSSTLLPWVIPA